ncbi:unnamed protein product [Schistosoma mattheei]|uniref:Uncharacterized protein n=1 Tax=Schistosoma mattheei TaxID=31246 RepID=A0A183PWI5_9TREM|nr:unnamed protein product [Schistosoma mattheei]
MKQVYHTTKKLAGKHSKAEKPVKDKEGKSVSEIEEQRNRCVEHFRELLNMPAPLNPPKIETAHPDLSIDVASPTIEEIKLVIRQAISRKAPEPDNIILK